MILFLSGFRYIQSLRTCGILYEVNNLNYVGKRIFSLLLYGLSYLLFYVVFLLIVVFFPS